MQVVPEKAVDTFQPFVVFGASKSGTTWLQKTLQQHPEICCHFQRLVFPITGKLRSELLFSAPVVFNRSNSPYGGVFENKLDEELYALTRLYTLENEILSHKYVEKYRSGSPPDAFRKLVDYHAQAVRGLVRQTLCFDTDKPIVGSKAYTNLEELFYFFPNAKLIHIVRDGRDVAVSKRFHYLRQGAYFRGDERSWWLHALHSTNWGCKLSRMISQRTSLINERNYRTPGEDSPLLSRDVLEKLAREWANIVQYINRFAEQFPTHSLTIRYESLRTEPHEEIRRALEFLGADASDFRVNEIVDATSFEKIAKGDFFRKGISGDWKNHFSDENVNDFRRIAGDVLIEMGYEKTPNWSRNSA